ncbi:Protein CWC15-like protein A [Acromyrmex echinatior]|uniref:Protein CWC15-like protein A n=1 Tax=Acromyrmex echinatior TaxID=103372 RepID=F4WLS4_ACREC|nr:Protein CWC15-like protein A [Acromyrmex echinatior]
MTTAARLTFGSARGGQRRGEKDLSAITKQYSSRDLPSHTKLKYRELTASSAKKRKLDQVPFASLDALDDEESDSEDDTAALLAELQRIKKARVAEQAKKEMEKGRMENILSRKWDDVVFKNCARSEPKKKHDVFINDSVLSEFHCKFMTKYVK